MSPSTIGPSGPPSPTVSTPVPAAAAPRAAAGDHDLDDPTVDDGAVAAQRARRRAGVGDPVGAGPSAGPASLAIPAIGVDVPIRTVGLEADGQLEIPDETEVGWYALGRPPARPAPPCWPDTCRGTARPARSSGSPNWSRAPRSTSGWPTAPSARTRSSSGPSTPSRHCPVDRIWRTGGPETLVLITCGGAFNPDIRRYADNIVVYAVPVA